MKLISRNFSQSQDYQSLPLISVKTMKNIKNPNKSLVESQFFNRGKVNVVRVDNNEKKKISKSKESLDKSEIVEGGKETEEVNVNVSNDGVEKNNEEMKDENVNLEGEGDKDNEGNGEQEVAAD